MKIGLFDSGIGGLTVLRQLLRMLPGSDFVYLADTANLPYGNKTREQIAEYGDIKMRWMRDAGVDVVCIACNTTDSILNVEKYKNWFKNGVIRIIEPTVSAIVTEHKEINKIGVIATEATARSGAFDENFKRMSSNVKVLTVPCPELVPWIESGMENYDKGYNLLTKYLDVLVQNNVQGLIYGCTHYPLVSDIIERIINNSSVNLFDPGVFVAEEAYKRLGQTSNKISKLEFYVTDLSGKVKLSKMAESVLSISADVEVIKLTK